MLSKTPFRPFTYEVMPWKQCHADQILTLAKEIDNKSPGNEEEHSLIETIFLSFYSQSHEKYERLAFLLRQESIKAKLLEFQKEILEKQNLNEKFMQFVDDFLKQNCPEVLKKERSVQNTKGFFSLSSDCLKTSPHFGWALQKAEKDEEQLKILNPLFEDQEKYEQIFNTTADFQIILDLITSPKVELEFLKPILLQPEKYQQIFKEFDVQLRFLLDTVEDDLKEKFQGLYQIASSRFNF